MRALVLMAFLAAGCAAEPVAYHSGNEIPDGPGMLTGEKGAVVLNADVWREPREDATAK
ncbi:MAG TPA: hypothetical protein VFC18_10365 [Burkholderiales bacterium]|nr:hypothetical protein [Burkholderiales bacterium]